MEPTQLSIQWIQGGSFPGSKAAWELKANGDKHSSGFCLLGNGET